MSTDSATSDQIRHGLSQLHRVHADLGSLKEELATIFGLPAATSEIVTAQLCIERCVQRLVTDLFSKGQLVIRDGQG